MSSTQEQLRDLQEIRNMMERSSKFVSLSGLSGIAAGVCALIGATIAYLYIHNNQAAGEVAYYDQIQQTQTWGVGYARFLMLDGLGTAVCAAVFATLFTKQKANRQGLKLYNKTSVRLFFQMVVPLVCGGVFCLALLYHGQLAYIAPATLVFYGLALFNASKYTFHDVIYLGFANLILGCIGLFWLRHGLILWVFGFGVSHIIYGVWMYFKYDRQLSE